MSFNEIKQHGREDFPFELYNEDVSKPKYEMAFHYHNHIELVYVVSGKLEITLNNKKYNLLANDILFINPETIHGATPTDCVYKCLVFNPAFLKNGNRICDEFIDDLLSQRIFIYEKINDKDVLDTIFSLMKIMEEKKEGYTLSTFGKAYTLLSIIMEKKLYATSSLQLEGKKEQNVVKLKKVLKYIRDNYANDISLYDMAFSAGLSTKYFCAFFKNQTGKTPIEYLRAYRIERASRMLINTDEQITNIAYNCGFNDFSFFIKTFKKIKNTTPKKYRDSNPSI